MLYRLQHVPRHDAQVALPPSMLTPSLRPPLVVSLWREEGRVCLSWVGLKSQSDSIEVDALLAKLNGLPDGQQVKAQVLLQAPLLSHVRMFSSQQEYALLSQNRFHLESQFLNTTKVLSKGLVLPIHCANQVYQLTYDGPEEYGFIAEDTQVEVVPREDPRPEPQEEEDSKYLVVQEEKGISIDHQAQQYVLVSPGLMASLGWKEEQPYLLQVHYLNKPFSFSFFSDNYHHTKPTKHNTPVRIVFLKPDPSSDQLLLQKETLRCLGLYDKSVVRLQAVSGEDQQNNSVYNARLSEMVQRRHLLPLTLCLAAPCPVLLPQVKTHFLSLLTQKDSVLLYHSQVLCIGQEVYQLRVDSPNQGYSMVHIIVDSLSQEQAHLLDDLLHRLLRIDSFSSCDPTLAASYRQHLPFRFDPLLFFSSALPQIHEFLHSPLQTMFLVGQKGVGKSYLLSRVSSAKHNVSMVDLSQLHPPGQATPSLQMVSDYLSVLIHERCLHSGPFLQQVFILEGLPLFCPDIESLDPQETNTSLVSKALSKQLRVLQKRLCFKMVVPVVSVDQVNQSLLHRHQVVTLDTPSLPQRQSFFHIQYSIDNPDLVDNTKQMRIKDYFSLVGLLSLQPSLSPIQAQQQVESFLCSQELYRQPCALYPTFSDIAGLSLVKQRLLQVFEYPLKYSFLFSGFSSKLATGALLYGPSGCGKTFLGQAVANQIGVKCLSVKGPELLNKYIGASEQSVRDVFEKAQRMSPCLLFFDEFESVVPKRQAGSTNVTDRVVNQFLCYLDGVEEVQGVFVLAASSRPELIDPALLRPGRLSEHIYVELPGPQDRRDLLDMYVQQMGNLEKDVADRLDDMVAITEGFTSADIAAAMKEIQLDTATEAIKAREQQGEQEQKGPLVFQVGWESIRVGLEGYHRSYQKEEVKALGRHYEAFRTGKGKDIKNQRLISK